jgi:hypothetical protein
MGHHCDNPLCCNPAHLTPGTHADNTADKVAKGRQYRKLAEADKAAIRERHAAGGVSMRALAREYGVAHPQIVRAPHPPRFATDGLDNAAVDHGIVYAGRVHGGAGG